MSLRFDYILSEIKKDSIGVADIGTDHGYVPILLAKSGYKGNIIASDVNQLPLDKAFRNAESEDVTESISFVLSDGLKGIDKESVDTIIVAGMGSDLICRILDSCDWIFDTNYKLILQPATRPEVLVYWLDNNGFNIEKDYFIFENGKLFRVLTCRYSSCKSVISDIDLYCGIRNLSKDRKIYFDKLTGFKLTLIKIITGLNSSGTDKSEEIAYYNKLLAAAESILSEVNYGK